MIAICILLLCVPAVMSAQSASQSVPQDKGINQLVASFEDAWNRHDAHAFAETFAEDADFTNVIGMSAHGQRAVEEFHAPMFATRFKNTHQTATDVKIRFLSPTMASVDVRWEMTGALDVDGSPVPLRKGLLNWIVTKNGERWLITVMHNQDLPAGKM
jgi:uncharacterized protein (TIGR02246 family)